uniref:ZP domain-containing protein n=1 Tax=Steinernema glaseri TaxID=37863 RepID=A0A1I7YHM1_9BILA
MKPNEAKVSSEKVKIMIHVHIAYVLAAFGVTRYHVAHFSFITIPIATFTTAMTHCAAIPYTPTEAPFVHNQKFYVPRLEEDRWTILKWDIPDDFDIMMPKPPSWLKIDKGKGVKIAKGRPGKNEVVFLETCPNYILAHFCSTEDGGSDEDTCIKLNVPREENETIVVDGNVLFQYYQVHGCKFVRMCRFDDETFDDRRVPEYYVCGTTQELSSPEFLHFSAQPPKDPKDDEDDTFVIIDVVHSGYLFYRDGVWRMYRNTYPKRAEKIAPYKFRSSATVNDRFIILHSFSQQQKEEMQEEQRKDAAMTPFYLDTMDWSILRPSWKLYKFKNMSFHIPNVETRVSCEMEHVVVSGKCIHKECSDTHVMFVPVQEFCPIPKDHIEKFNARQARIKEELRLRPWQDQDNRYIGANGRRLFDKRVFNYKLYCKSYTGFSFTNADGTTAVETRRKAQPEDEDSVPPKRRKLCLSCEPALREADVPGQENSLPPPIKVSLMEEEAPSEDGKVKMEKESPQVVPKDSSCEMDTEPHASSPKSENSLSEGTSSPPEGRPSSTPEEESNRDALERSESDLQKECSQGALSPSNGDRMEGLEKTDPEGESSTDSTPACIVTLLATLVETVDSMNATLDQEHTLLSAEALESAPEEECGLFTPASVLAEVQPALEPFEENEPGSASQKSDEHSTLIPRTSRKRKLTSPTDFVEQIVSLDVELSRSFEAKEQLATEDTFREAMQKESCSSTIHVQAISPVTPQEDTSTGVPDQQEPVCSQLVALEDQPMSQPAIFHDWGNEVQENTPPILNDQSAMEKDGIVNDVFLSAAEEVSMNSEEDFGTLPSLESSMEVQNEFSRKESHLATEGTFREAMQKESCTSTIQVQAISPVTPSKDATEPQEPICPQPVALEDKPESQPARFQNWANEFQTSATHPERGYVEPIITLDVQLSKSFEADEGKHMEGFVEVEFAREESHLTTEGTFREAFPKESCSSTIQVQVIVPVTPQEDTSTGAADPQEPICSHPVALEDQPESQLARIEDSANEVQENTPPTLNDHSAMEKEGIINDVFLGAAEENSMDSMEYASSTPSPTGQEKPSQMGIWTRRHPTTCLGLLRSRAMKKKLNEPFLLRVTPVA